MKPQMPASSESRGASLSPAQSAKKAAASKATTRLATTRIALRKDDHVRARIETAIKHEAEAVLAAIGLTVSDAMRLMLYRVVEEKRLPFDPLVPNEATIAAMRASRRDEVTHVGTPRNLMTALDAD